MNLAQLGTMLALALSLVCAVLESEARNNDIVDRTLKINDRLLVLAAPPHGATDTADMPQGAVLSLLESVASLQLRGDDLQINFPNGGTMLIKNWVGRASGIRLLSGATLNIDAVVAALRGTKGQVPIASLEKEYAISPPRPRENGFGPTRGPLGGGAAWLVAREILEPGESEPGDFRAYSYLLFADNTAVGPGLERRLAAIRAYARQFEAVASLRRRHRIEPRQTNLFIALVDDKWRRTDGDPDAPETVVEALIRNYDFTRARLLLRKVGLPSRGPYIISGSEPLLGDKEVPYDQLMVLDLSWIPPRLVDLWLTKFRRVAEGEYAWESGSLHGFALKLRTGLEVIGEAFSLTREAVGSVLKLPK